MHLTAGFLLQPVWHDVNLLLWVSGLLCSC